MAGQKNKANMFTTDIDLCKNQIKNATWEHWTKNTLPSEESGDVLFEGRMLFLEKDIPTIIEGKPYTYEAGSVIICHKVDGEFYFLKQLSSLQTEDVTGAIKELWRSKSGVIRGYATKAALDAALGEGKDPVVIELDIGIVTADETKEQATTMYMAAKNGGSWEGKAADKWNFISVVGKDWQPALDKKFNCVTSDETGGASFSVPYGVDVSGGLPLDEEGLNNLKLKTIWLDNRTNRVDTYTIPGMYKLKPVFDGNEVKVAGLYGKTAAEKKVDVFQGVDKKDNVMMVDENGNVAPRDFTMGLYYGEDGVIVDQPDRRVHADWDKVAHYPGKATATEEYNLPYHIDTPVQDADKITAKFYTVALNKDNTKKDFSISIPKADITGNKAGLYTKDLADKKLDLPGKAPGTDQPLRLPYFFEQSVDGDKVTVTAHTVKLDNTENKVDEKFTMVVLPADITGDKAGLYTKALAEVKADKTYVDDELAKKLNLPGKAPGTEQPLRLPYYFDKTGDDTKVTVKAHTVKLNNDPQPQTPEYFTMVVESATPNASATVTNGKAGLMSAADKYKLDNCVIKDDSKTEEANTWSAKKINDMIVSQGADFVGSVKDRTELSNLQYKKGGSIKIDANDFTVVLDDTGYPGGTHDKECWRYRCIDPGILPSLSAWEPEYRISNVPFTNDQWAMINGLKVTVGTTGTSYMANRAGDEGACLKFEHADGTKSAVAVNNGGGSGIAAQIYAIGASATDGVKLNVRKSGLYYLKNKATLTTEDPDDEIATKGDLASAIVGGRMLSKHWNCMDGKANDLTTGVTYKIGDYFVVETIAGGGSNYKPTGSAYTPATPSTEVETETVSPGDYYIYTANNTWTLKDHTKFSFTVSYDKIAGDPNDSFLLKKEFDGKLNKLPIEPYSHMEYRFPFHIETPVQNPGDITATFHTLVINDGVTRDSYNVTIPAADFSGADMKAGLYTKTLADAKQDKMVAATDAEIDAVWS